MAPGRTLYGSAVAGGAAAATATVSLHPVDTVKTVLQGQTQALTARPSLGQTLTSLGARGLYRGVSAAAFSMMPACAVRMGSYEMLKQRFLTVPPEYLSPGSAVILASASSVVVSASVRAPLDMVKTQLQAGTANSMQDALSKALERGVRGLYRGAELSLLRDVPFFSINLFVYERLKAVFLSVRHPPEGASNESKRPLARLTFAHQAKASIAENNRQLGSCDAIVVGAAAQGVAGFLTNPVDAIKTRVQSGMASNFRTAVRDLLQKDGVRGLTRGATMRVLFIAPQGCVYYPVYELVLAWMHK